MKPEPDAGASSDAAPDAGLQRRPAEGGRPPRGGAPEPGAPIPMGPIPGMPPAPSASPSSPVPSAPLPPSAPTAGVSPGTGEFRVGRGRLVVAVALLDRERRVLAARRTSPSAYAGM